MSVHIPDTIHPDRQSRRVMSLKGESVVSRISLKSSVAFCGEIVYIDLPKLSGDTCIDGTSLALIANFVAGGEPNRYWVNNIGRAIVNRVRLLYSGNVISDINRSDLILLYKDLWLPPGEREDLIEQGVDYGQNRINLRKLRSGAANADTSDVGEVALKNVHTDRVRIPLDLELLAQNGAINTNCLPGTFQLEVTLAQVDDVLLYDKDATGSPPPPSLKLTNMELEFRAIRSQVLADQVSAQYSVGKHLTYRHILHYGQTLIDAATDNVVNISLDVPLRSLEGVLILFTATHVTGTRNPERFIYPNITDVQVTHRGEPNKLFNRGMKPYDYWDSAKSYFSNVHGPGWATTKWPVGTKNDGYVTQKRFFEPGQYGDKFCLFVDTRCFPDPDTHGGGTHLDSARGALKIQITRGLVGSGTITAHTYLISDAVMEIANRDLVKILY